MEEFDLTDSFISYATKPDISNCNRSLLIRGSLNTLISDAERVDSREGYTRYGAEGVSDVPGEAGFDWDNSTEESLHFRSQGTVLELYIASIGDVTFNSWQTLLESLTSVDFVFDAYWDNTEKIDRMIACNGGTSLYDWSGGRATFLSATVNTLTIQGTATIASRRFLTSGTRQIRIKDTGGTWRTFTYTGGESGLIFTGLTSDPTAFTFDVGAPILQEIVVRATPLASATTASTSTFLIDMLKVANNHLFLGSRTSRRGYFSKNTDIADYTFAAPRIAGNGGTFLLDQSMRAIRTLRDFVIPMTSDYLYRTEFQEITVSSTLTESFNVKRLKTASGQGALSHNLSEETDNGITYVSKGQELLILEDVSNVEQPLISVLSDIIKPTFDAADFDNGQMKLHKNRLYISTPADSLSYIFETRLKLDGTKVRFWQPPQTIPARAWAVIDGEIHCHSSVASETYKLFDGLNDIGNPILCRAFLAKYNMSGAERCRLKSADEIYNEGYISENTTISVLYLFEGDKGETELIEKTIKGADEVNVYSLDPDPSLGTSALGDFTLSGGDDEEPLPKFRIIHEVNPKEFFDYETRLETNDTDQQWSWLATGPNAELSDSHASAIKR